MNEVKVLESQLVKERKALKRIEEKVGLQKQVVRSYELMIAAKGKDNG